MSEHFLSTEALEMLDRLWAIPNMSLRDIRQKMQTKFGTRFSDEEIVAAARRNDKPVEAKPAIVLTPRARVWKQPQTRDTQCKARVKPGTFPVPVGGYKIGRHSNGR